MPDTARQTDVEVARITAAAVERARRGEPLSPASVELLVRQDPSGRDGVGDVLGDALARALTHHAEDDATRLRAGWAVTFAEATTVSDDPRLGDAARGAIDALVGDWPAATVVDEAAVSIDACLFAAPRVERQALVPAAVDELERVVASAYRPGDGVSHGLGGMRVRGGASDYVRLASALLTAFDLTGRLPYSMLAEELVQTSRDALASADVAVACDAARVLCRLARLHDDAEYRAAAVIAGGADYRADAWRILEHLTDQLSDPRHADADLYALALSELTSTRVDG